MAIKLAIGSDHRGYAHKKYLCEQDCFIDIVWHDVGTDVATSSDYPLFAQKAVELVVQDQCDGAILLCGTGVGMAIAANRFNKIYAGVAWCVDVARRAREEDAVNVLVIPADFVLCDAMVHIVHAWHKAQFKHEERYIRRLNMIDQLG